MPLKLSDIAVVQMVGQICARERDAHEPPRFVIGKVQRLLDGGGVFVDVFAEVGRIVGVDAST